MLNVIDLQERIIIWNLQKNNYISARGKCQKLVAGRYMDQYEYALHIILPQHWSIFSAYIRVYNNIWGHIWTAHCGKISRLKKYFNCNLFWFSNILNCVAMMLNTFLGEFKNNFLTVCVHSFRWLCIIHFRNM